MKRCKMSSSNCLLLTNLCMSVSVMAMAIAGLSVVISITQNYLDLQQSIRFMNLRQNMVNFLYSPIYTSLKQAVFMMPRGINDSLDLSPMVSSFLVETVLNTGTEIKNWGDYDQFIKKYIRSRNLSYRSSVDMFVNLNDQLLGNLSDDETLYMNQILLDFMKKYLLKWTRISMINTMLDILLEDLLLTSPFFKEIIGILFIAFILSFIINCCCIMAQKYFVPQWRLIYWTSFNLLVIFSCGNIAVFIESYLEVLSKFQKDSRIHYFDRVLQMAHDAADSSVSEYADVEYTTESSQFEYLGFTFDRPSHDIYAEALLEMFNDRHFERFMKTSDLFAFYTDSIALSTNFYRDTVYSVYFVGMQQAVLKYRNDKMDIAESQLTGECAAIMKRSDKLAMLFKLYTYETRTIMGAANLKNIMDIFAF